jgi:drug/metabolite transporter (DMT)-like permease
MTLTRVQANLTLLTAALLWGAGNVAQKTILSDIGPFMAVGLRCAIAFAVVAPFAFRHRAQAASIDRRGWLLLLATAVSFAVAVTLLQVGYGHTTVTNAGFLVNVTTVMVPFAAWVLLRSKPTLLVVCASMVTLGGAYLMGGGDLAKVNYGDLLCLVSAVCYSIWFIALGEFARHYGQPCLLAAVQFGVTAILTLGFGAAFETTTSASLAAATPELIMLGVASTGIAYLLQGYAQKYTSAAEAAIIASAEAVFGAIGGMLMLNERLDGMGVAGSVLILLGILAVQLPMPVIKRKVKEQAEASPALVIPLFDPVPAFKDAAQPGHVGGVPVRVFPAHHVKEGNGRRRALK